MIELIEYEPYFWPEDMLSSEMGRQLWQVYGDKVLVEFPSPKTDQSWRLTGTGWVGHIPLSADFQITIKPKVTLDNLWQMWAYAYNLHNFQWLAGLARTASLTDFFVELAYILAIKVMECGRSGFYRTYSAKVEPIPFLRGQLQWRQSWSRPYQANLLCRFDDHTADIADNQILAYTLGQIARSHRCPEPVQTAVSQAYRRLQSITTPHPFQPQDCVGRRYTRLNQDYQPLHALCRFFLEHTAPAIKKGDHHMLPFLVNMARLYELFVAEWLKIHLPSPWQIKSQERVMVGVNDELQFDVDLVLYDSSGRARTVLDTKYKTPTKPSNNDISQIVTYAKAKGCQEAVLIYPAALQRPLDLMIGDIHLRSLTFTLSGDLEQAGQQFLSNLIP